MWLTSALGVPVGVPVGSQAEFRVVRTLAVDLCTRTVTVFVVGVVSARGLPCRGFVVGL